MKWKNNNGIFGINDFYMDAADEEYYELNEAQNVSIEIGRAQIKNGAFKTNEEVMREMRKLLLIKPE